MCPIKRTLVMFVTTKIRFSFKLILFTFLERPMNARIYDKTTKKKIFYVHLNRTQVHYARLIMITLKT